MASAAVNKKRATTSEARDEAAAKQMSDRWPPLNELIGLAVGLLIVINRLNATIRDYVDRHN